MNCTAKVLCLTFGVQFNAIRGNIVLSMMPENELE